MEAIETWALEELRRMDDVRARLAPLLAQLQEAADLPLLKQTLQEQRDTNAAQLGRLQRMFEALGIEGGGGHSAVAEAMVQEARDAVAAVDGLPRDFVIAQHAVRIEFWELGVWRGLLSVYRLMMQDAVADQIDALIDDLAAAERHLASVAAAITPEEEPRHEHQTTIRRTVPSPMK